MKRRQLDSIGLQRRAEAAARIFRRALALALRSLEESRSKPALSFKEYSLWKHLEIP